MSVTVLLLMGKEKEAKQGSLSFLSSFYSWVK